MLRINPDNNCIIQKLDCDGNWQTWIDVSKCSASSTFDLQVNIGGINFGSGQPAVAECHDYDLIHESTGITLIPVTMSTGDTITFSDWKGAATDGFSVNDIFDITILPVWYCPSGQNFALNECHDDPLPPHSDDPFQALAHMRAVFIINNVAYDAYNTTVTIPTGVANQQGYVMLNDHNLGDNSGVEQFHARVCALGAVTTWTKVFDFKASPCGFVSDTRDGHGAQWTAGKGWGGIPGIDYDHASVCDFKLTLPADTHLTFVHHYWHAEGIADDPGAFATDVYFPVPNGTARIENIHPNTDRDAFAVVNQTGALIQVAGFTYPAASGTTQQMWCTKLILQGDAPEPIWPA